MTDKTALVTGANKSIGYETARRLGEAGYRVWLGSRDRERGEAAAAELRQKGHDVRVLERFSFVDVPADRAAQVAETVSGNDVRGVELRMEVTKKT